MRRRASLFGGRVLNMHYLRFLQSNCGRIPPGSEYSSSEHASSSPGYLPYSSPAESPTEEGSRVRTRSQVGCAPFDGMGREDFPDSDSDPASPEPGLQRKRGFSQIASSPPTQQSTRRTNTRRSKGGQSYEHTNKFCTQQCLLGLQKGGASLDENCPNVNLHQQGQDNNQHQISADGLVQALKQQLDENIDHNCTPIGQCGSYGAPFKITSTAYGYTVIGKGTTTWLWKEVSHEADIYHVLRRAQGSTVPVFLGSIDLAKTYFLHGAGEIRHMLLMGWGGENTTKITIDKTVRREISRSRKEIRSLGVVHQDLRWENILWNAELRRALIIDFHRSALDGRPMEKRTRALKRSSSRD